MKVKVTILFLLIVTLVLAACNSNATNEVAMTKIQAADQVQIKVDDLQMASNHETLVDEQGAVGIAVTPLNLNAPELETIAFDIAMDTHSVDLSMDLATLATLTTDKGDEVRATLWDAQPGGHHVSGILSFPTMIDGTAVLAGASQLTLTIRDVDTPERIFSWQLDK